MRNEQARNKRKSRGMGGDQALFALVGRSGTLSLNVALRRTLPQQLQTPLGQAHHLSLIVVFGLVVRLHLAVGDLLDHLDNVIRLPDKPDELLVLRLEQLKQGPDRNVLESGIAAGKEPAEVAVDAVTRLHPVLNKDAVIAHCLHVSKGIKTNSSGNVPLEERLPKAAALLP